MRSIGTIILEEVANYKEADQRLVGIISKISEIKSGELQTSLLGRLA